MRFPWHLESDRVKLVAMKAIIAQELEIETISVESLAVNWQDPASYFKLQEIGRDWLISCRTPILKVPSAIVPVEHNYLFNPEHPDLNFEIKSVIEFKFDSRMWKKLP